MIFGQFVKEILVKHNQVWIPDFGMLRYQEGSSKIIIDSTSIGNDDHLLAAIVQRKGIAPNEAQVVLANQVFSMKSALKTSGKYHMDGIGDIVEFNGSYQVIEEKKSLFPSDFFGGSTFNFSENKTSTDFYSDAFKDRSEDLPEKKEVKLEPVLKKVVEPIIEVAKEEVPAELIVEPKKETTSTLDDLFNSVKEQEEKNDNQNISIETSNIDDESDTDESQEVHDSESNVEVEIENKIKEKEPEHADLFASLKAELENDDFEEDDDEIESNGDLEESKAFTLTVNNETAESIEEPAPIEEPIIDPRSLIRRDIGRSNYDEGFYDHLVNKKVSNKEGIRLGRVLPIGLALAALAFFIPWIIASMNGSSFLGLAPLWNAKKTAVKKATAPIAKVDTAVIDTSKMDIANKIDTSSTKPLSNSVAKSVAEPVKQIPTPAGNKTPEKPAVKTSPNVPAKPADPISEKPKQLASVTNEKSTKTKSSSSVPEKSVKTEKSSKSTKTDKSSQTDNSKIASNSTDTASKKMSSEKLVKKNDPKPVIGKYATAPYTQGNTYLSFGSFKIPKNAGYLRSELKKKAGIETDIVLVNGEYKVVIPYTNKQKAVEAAKELPNTSIFE